MAPWPQVHRLVPHVHPLTGEPIEERSLFIVRTRERTAAAAAAGSAGRTKEHAWELVQVPPRSWCLPRDDATHAKVCGLSLVIQMP